jgi:hypothetical protein
VNKLPLLGSCVEAAATLVAANGRVGTMDQVTVLAQVAEMAIDLYTTVERRTVSHRQSQSHVSKE